jgi:hypothetical protein
MLLHHIPDVQRDVIGLVLQATEQVQTWRVIHVWLVDGTLVTGFNVFLIFLMLLNLLKPTGHVMHQQFNIQQLYVLSTLYLCVLYLSENKQRLVPLTA